MLLSSITVTAGEIEFEEVTVEAGLAHRGPTAGASWGDYNGDGWPDLWVGNHGFDKADPKLFLNNRDGTFVDRSDLVSVPEDADLHGAAWADFDRDGDADLFIMAGGGGGDGASPNLLLVNSDGQLKDAASTWQIALPEARGRTPLWLDANQDGKLDLLLSNMHRADGLGRTQLLFQGEAGFVPAQPQPKFAPHPRGFWRQTKFLISNLLSYRGQDEFGSMHALDVFAQLSDVDSDGHADVVAYGSPTYVYSLRDQGAIELDSQMIATERQVADVVHADFNGDLQFDTYVVRLRDAAPDLVQESATVIKAHLQASNGVSARGLRFQADAKIAVEIIDLWEITDQLPPVYIGSSRTQPQQLRFELDASDERAAGPLQHMGSPEVLIGFDQSTQTWVLENWSGRINVEIRALSGVLENPIPLNFETHDGSLRDRLLLQDESIFMKSGQVFDTNCSSVVAADFDNDMDVDLFLACAEPTRNAHNVLMLNDGSGRFDRVPDAGGAKGSALGRSDVVVAADYDRDGAVDLFVTNGRGARPFTDAGPYELFRNTGGTNHWLGITLVGRASNFDAIGAIVRASAGGKTQARIQDGGMHSFAQNHSMIHFGLGINDSVDTLKIHWPSGQVQTLRDVAADQFLRIVEP